MKKKLIFNAEGRDTLDDKRIINGNTTNILQLNTIKYSWAREWVKKQRAVYWLPEKFSLTDDVNDYQNLSVEEKDAFENILSFLTFLDSLQTYNLVGNLVPYITAPEISVALTVQADFEEIHTESYQYIIESIIPERRRDYIYDLWRGHDLCVERNEYIASFYQRFQDNPNEENFLIALVANYILEGLYFYNNFTFFYSLSARHLLQGTSDIISKINIDEELHVKLFQYLIKDFIKETGVDKKAVEDTIVKMFEDAVEQEIRFSNYVLGDNILGISYDSIESYTKYLANLRIKGLGFKKIYDGVENPYSHLESISNTKTEHNNKSNFFETTVGEYQMSTQFTQEDWDF